MRIIKEKTLKKFSEQEKYKPARKSLLAWIYEVRYSS